MRSIPALALLAGAFEASGQTFFWNRNAYIAGSADFNKAYNWTSNGDGTGTMPISGTDDPFTADALGAPWTFLDLDNDVGTGAYSLTANSDQLTLTGRGSDIFNTTNQFVAVHRADIPGDFDVTVRVLSQTSTAAAAKTGLMMANDFGALSQGGYAFVALRPDGTVEWGYDITGPAGQIESVTLSSGGLTAPIWLRLVRTGTTARALYKTTVNGAWIQVGAAQSLQGLTAGTPSRIGLFACSHNAAATMTSVFDDFQGGTDFGNPGYDLSFNGTGAYADAAAVVTNDMIAASVDFTGYSGSFDFSQENGLLASIYDGTDFNTFMARRPTDDVNYPMGTLTAIESDAGGGDTYSVRWEGRVQPAYSQNYTFYVEVDDGARLWVDNVLLIDQWMAGGLTEYSGSIALTAGQKYPIRLEYMEGTANSAVMLKWSSASQPKTAIPGSALFLGALSVQGNLTFSPGMSILPGKGPVHMVGTGAQTLVPKVGTLHPGFVKSGSGTVTVSTHPLVAGSLDLQSGSWNWGTGALNHSVKSIQTSGSSTMAFGSHTVEVTEGNCDLSGLGALNAGSGTLAFSASTGQILVPLAGATHPHIAKNGAGTVTVAANDLTAASLSVSGGTFDLSTNARALVSLGDLILNGGALNAAAGSLEIRGNVAFTSGTLSAPNSSGSFTVEGGFTHSAGTFAPNGGTVTFDGTATGNSISLGGSFHHLTLDGSGGGWTLGSNATVSGALTITDGTLAVSTYSLTAGSLVVNGGTLSGGSGAVAVNGDLSLAGGALDASGGSLSVTGNIAATSGTLSLPGGTTYLAGSFTQAAGATLTHNGGTVTLNGAAAGKVLNVAGSLHNLSVAGSGGEWTVTATGLTVAGNLSLSASTLRLGSLTSLAGAVASSGGALDFGSGTLAVTAGNVNLGGLGTLTPGSGWLAPQASSGVQVLTPKSGATHPHIAHNGAGELELASYDLTCLSFSNGAGILDFGGRNITTVSGGGFNVSNGTASTLVGLGGRTLTVAGNAVLGGAAGTSRLNLDGGAAWYLNVTGTAAVSLATVQNANSGGYATVACANCANLGTNSNWTFATAWDGGGGDANWSTPANWGGDAVPTAEDAVTFNATSLGAVLDANATVKSLTMTSGYTGSLDFGSSTLTITGNADFRSGGGIIANAGTLAFTGTGAQTFIPKSGATFPAIHQNGNAGTTTIATNPLTAGNLTLGLGTFHLGTGMTHTLGAILGGGGLDFGSSSLNVGGSVDLSAHAVTATSANTLAFVGAAAKTFTPNASEPDLVIAQTGSGTVTLAGAVTTPSLTLAAGRLNLGSYTHSAALVSFTGGILDFGSATLQTPAAAVDLSALGAHIPGSGTLAFTGSSAQTFTPTPSTGNVKLSLRGSGGVTFAADVTTLGLDIQSGTLNLGSGRLHTVTGGNITTSGGGLDFSSSVLKVQGSVNLAGLATLAPGTGILRFYTSGTPTLTPKASATHPHIEQVAASTLTLATNALSCLSFTQSAGTLDLGGQNLATVSAGDFTVTNGSPASFSGLAGRTLTVAGDASFTGASAGGKVNLNPGSAWTLAVSGTLTATLAALANNTASASAGACTGCANGGANSNWTFATGWDGGGADGNWSTAGNWSGDIVPGAEDAVTFNAASVKSATLDAAATIKSITFTSGYTGTFSFSSSTLTVDGGGADFRSGGAIAAGAGTLAFTGGGSQTFIPKAGTAFPAIHHNSNAGTTTVTTHPLTAGVLTLGMGTFHLGASMTHTLAGIGGAGGLDFGTSNLDVTGNVDLGSQTVTATSASTLAFTGSSAQTFIPKASEPDLNLTQNGSGGTTVSTYDFATPTLTIAQGTLNLGTGRTHSVASVLSVSGGGLDFGSSTLQVAAATVNLSSLATLVPGTGTLHFNGSSAQTFTPKASATHPNIRQYGSGGTTLATHNLAAGSLTLNQGTFHLGAGLTHAFTSVSDGGGGPYGSLHFGSSQLQVTSGNAAFTNMPAVTVGTGSLVFTASTGVQWLAPKSGGATHPPIQHTGAGTLRLGGTLTCAGFANSAGTLDLNGFDIATAASGDFTVTNGTASTFAGLGGRTVAVGGNATFAGTSAASRLNLNPASAWTLNVTGTASANLASVMNGNASGGSTAACTDCANEGANGNWSFAMGWTGTGGNSNWTNAANWGGGAVPSPLDAVTFATGSANVVLDAAATVKSIQITTGYSGNFNFSSNTLTVAGNADFSGNGTFTPGTGALVLTGTASHAFKPKSGAALPAITLNGAGGTYTVTTYPLAAAGLTVTAGTFHLGSSLTHDLGTLDGAGTLDFGTSNVNATGDVDLSGLTVNATASNTLAFAGSGAQTFRPKAALTALNLSQTGSGTTTVTAYDFTTPTLTLSAGTLNLGAARTHLVTQSLSISGGALDFASSALRVQAATVDLRNLAGLTPGTGSLQFTRTAAQTFIPHASLSLPALHQYGAGGTTTVTTHPLLSTNALSIFLGTFHLGSGLIHSVGSMGGTGGSGALDFGGSTLRINTGNASLGLVAAVTAGTGTLEFTAASGTQILTPLAGYGAPHILHSGAGTLQIAGADLSCLSFTQNAGALDLNGRNLATTGNFTVANGHPSSFAGLGGRTLTAQGDVSIAGSAGNIVNLDPATAWTLAAAGSLSASYASVARANASASAGSAVNSSDGGANTNWTFQVSWTGGAADNNWTSAANWGANAVPGASVNVLFDATSTKGVVLDAAASVKSIVFTSGYTGSFDFGANTLTVAVGDADFRSGGAFIAGTGTLAFASSGAQAFHPKAGATFPNILQSGAGTTTVGPAALSAGNLSITGGAFHLGSGLTHTVADVAGTGALLFGTSNLNATGNVNLSGLAVSATSASTLAFTGGAAQTFTPKASATDLNLAQSGAGGVTVLTYAFTAPNLTVSAGTLNLGAGLTHAVTSGLSVTGGGLDFASSTLRTSAATVDLTSLATLVAGTGTLEFAGSSAQSLVPKAAATHPAILQSGTGGTSIATRDLAAGALHISAGTWTLGTGLTHLFASVGASGGGLAFGSSTLRSPGNVSLSGLASLTPGTGTLEFTAAVGTQVFTPRASATHPAMAHTGAGTLQLSTHGLSAASYAQSAGTLDFAGQDVGVAGDFTLTNGSAGSFNNLAGRTVTVGGNASFTGQAGNLANLNPASAWTLAVSGSLNAALAQIANCNATVSPGDAVSSTDGSGNTNWSFAVTWDGGGADNNWTTGANWSSDVAPAGSLKVIFDATSSKNCVLDGAATVKSVLMGTGYAGTFSFSTNTLSVTGNADFRSGGPIAAGTGTLAFAGPAPQSFIPKSGGTFPGITQNGSGGTTISINALAAGALNIMSGTFSLGSGFTHAVASVGGSGGGLDFSSSTLRTAGNVDLSGLSAVNAGTGLLELTGGGSQILSPKAGASHPRVAKTGTGTATVVGAGLAAAGLRIAAGTLHLGTGLVHSALDSLLATGGTLDFGSSTLRTGAASPSLAGLAGLAAGTGTLEFNGVSAQTFTPKAGLPHPDLVQNGAGGTTVAGNSLQAGHVTLALGTLNLGTGLSHAVGGFSSTGGGLDFGASTVATSGGVDLGGLATLIAGTGTLSFTSAAGTQVFVPKNGVVHPLLTHPSAGTVRLSGGSLTARGFDQTAGSLDLNGFDLSVSGAGNLSVRGAALPILGLAGRTLTVTGNAQFTGTAATQAGLDPASPWTLAVSGSLSAVNARIRNSQATLSAGIADSSLNLGGNTGWTFLDTIKPDNVTGFLASATPSQGIALTWTASASADADSVMLRYRTDGAYPASRTDGTLWRRVKADRTVDTATGLPDKTVYHFAAFVKDSSGNYSPAAAAARDSARLPDVTPPANVTALVADGLTASSAALSWIPAIAADADSVMIRYRTGLAHPSGPADGTLWRMLPVAADRDTVTGLATNTVHAFSLFVRDSSGNYSPAAPSARDTSLYQIPITGTLAVSDASGLTADGDPALAFTWSGADSLRFSLLADTAAAAWKAVRALDSLPLGATDGRKVVAVQFKNVYGRRSPWYRDTTWVDRTAPAVTLGLEPELGRWTWPEAVSGTSKDSLAGTAMVFVVRRRISDGSYFNGTAWQAAADTAKLALSGSDTLFSAPLPASAMATGDYEFTAYARDRVGNTGPPSTQAVRYEANRAPAPAYGNVKDTLLQNQAVSWTLDLGDLDAGDSLAQVSLDAPAWLAVEPGTDTAWAPWAVHKTYSLSGRPGQAEVGSHVVRIRVQDRGGLILTWADTLHVADVNDAPVWNDSETVYSAKEDETTAWIPRFEDLDPQDQHTLALLSGPAFAKVEGLSVILKPGSRDVGEFGLVLVVSDGELADTVTTALTVVNVNDKPYAFASAGFPSPAFFREDRPDSFSVVVVDLDRHEPVVFAGQAPPWMKVSMAVDSTGYNRTFTFRVHPTQSDTGSVSMALTFMDAAQAVAQLPLSGRILPDNDTPTAVVDDPRTHGGAARFRLSVIDEDGSLEKARFHYRLIGPSGDTVRRGLTPSSLLSLHPLADGDYRLAVRAEDQDGVLQGAFTVVPFSITGATTLSLDTSGWHMLGPQQAQLPASAFGAGATLAAWDEAGDDGQPLARYASGRTIETLKRGKGYWVRLSKPATLTAAQPDLAQGPVPLKLTRAKQGWNQVANPFPYWVDVSAAKLTFWEWDAERRDLVNARGVLKPWAAYWVLAAKDTTLLLADIPYFPAPQGGLAKSAASAGSGASFRHREDWSLQLGLRAGRYQDQANLLGVRAAAPVAASDPPRVLADAPKFGDFVALHFENPEAGEPAAQGYAQDFRAALDPEEEWWDFSVENCGTGETRALLAPAGLEGLAAAGLRVFLVKQGEARLIEPGQAAALDVAAEQSHYSLVVTPHADFAGRLKGNFSISQNFPNPVTSLTSFRFVLPQSWDRQGKRVARDFPLRIKVYDYAGREVARPVDGRFRPGTHTLRWSPVMPSGRPLAKGAYVYRLETTGFAKSMKMVVE